MRTIKFRGKRCDTKEWVYGHYFDGWYILQYIDIATNWWDAINGGNKGISDHNVICRAFEVIPETVGQFTGLLDKDGVEIYEGDTCRVLYTDWASKSESDSRTIEQYLIDIANVKVVQYDFNGFYFSHSIGGYSEDMSVGKYGYIKVIGNIHDTTPELKID